MEEKYIKLLLERCIDLKSSKSLFISCDKINQRFVNKLLKHVKKMGIKDIYLDIEDINVTHEKFKKLKIDEIKKDPYFNKSIWDTYAKKKASFLMLETEFPKLMDDIDPKKLLVAKETNRRTRKIFMEMENKMEIPWCIAALPNRIWAKELFKDVKHPYEKLKRLIYKCCMVDSKNPINSWNNYLKENKKIAEKLNKLKIKKLHYRNSLGTDLKVELPKDCLWVGGGDNKGVICNMPTYEIFTSPHYKKINGIVYNSLPLYYGGQKIDNFYIKFKNGKAYDYKAKVGNSILKGIIEGEKNCCYLGEVALVNHDSPISNTNIIYQTTLYDENAACHLALGDGFSEAIKNGANLSKDKLYQKGINKCKNHVDFMIGTKDLDIEAITFDGKQVKIFNKGNFDKKLISK